MELPGGELKLDDPVIMGVLNVTPDSFSDGGQFSSTDDVVAHAKKLVDDGASILDIGGESTRPGAADVPLDEELKRVVPVLEALREHDVHALLSIDTRKASVAAKAIELGVSIVNDVSALADPEMAAVVAQNNAGIILMHMRGTPQTMQEGPIHYEDVVADISEFLQGKAHAAEEAGIDRARIMIDPGIGFGKELEHNLQITNDIGALRALGYHVVYGPSRKRFLGDITGVPEGDRDAATAAACVAAIINEASVLRVHNPAAVRDAVAVATALRFNEDHAWDFV